MTPTPSFAVIAPAEQARGTDQVVPDAARPRVGYGAGMRMCWGRPDVDRYVEMFDLPGAAAGQGSGIFVTFGGVSTLLFSDGQSGILFDGFFSRPSLARVAAGRIAPDEPRIAAGLAKLGVGGLKRLEAVVPVHSHYDHALDSAVVANRTGARLVGGASTANLGRGAELSAEMIVTPAPGAPVSFGPWTLTLTESTHCPPDRFPGVIEEPLRPPARVAAWRCGEAWSARLEHATGRSALVQGSAGYLPGSLAGCDAEVVYLGVGQLGLHPGEYLHAYWEHVVRACGARVVVLTHWDDFFVPADPPLRATPYAGDDLDRSIAVLRALADEDAVDLCLPRVWRAEDPWSRA